MRDVDSPIDCAIHGGAFSEVDEVLNSIGESKQKFGAAYQLQRIDSCIDEVRKVAASAGNGFVEVFAIAGGYASNFQYSGCLVKSSRSSLDAIAQRGIGKIPRYSPYLCNQGSRFRALHDDTGRASLAYCDTI